MNAQVSNADSPSGGPAVPAEPTPDEHTAPAELAELSAPGKLAELAELAKQTATPVELATAAEQIAPAEPATPVEHDEPVEQDKAIEPSLPEPVRQRVVVLELRTARGARGSPRDDDRRDRSKNPVRAGGGARTGGEAPRRH